MPHTSPLAHLIPADSDPLPGYRAAKESAALFDVSATGKILVTGPEGPKVLHNLCTNDLENLPLGGGCEAYFCDHKAKALFQVRVYHVLVNGEQHALWMDTTPGYNEKLLQHLDRYLISEQAELADRTAEFVQLHVAGPGAADVLGRCIGETLPELGEFLHMERSIGDAVVSIRRFDPLGVPGYDLVCLNAAAEGLWRTLEAGGAKPASPEAFELLRVEAGTPVYGVDIDDNRFVMEVAHAARAVSYEKGCFLGQEPIVMSRDRAGHVNRAFLGVKLSERTAGAGAKVWRDGKEVGLVTSSVESPKLSTALALAYIRRGNQEPGTAVEVEDEQGKQPAEVIALPV